jgi:hypothetical protein
VRRAAERGGSRARGGRGGKRTASHAKGCALRREQSRPRSSHALPVPLAFNPGEKSSTPSSLRAPLRAPGKATATVRGCPVYTGLRRKNSVQMRNKFRVSPAILSSIAAVLGEYERQFFAGCCSAAALLLLRSVAISCCVRACVCVCACVRARVCVCVCEREIARVCVRRMQRQCDHQPARARSAQFARNDNNNNTRPQETRTCRSA